MLSILAAASLVSVAVAQQIGTDTAEEHPPITYEICTTAGGCAVQNGSVVLDANYRWTHNADFVTCNPDGFNATICPDAVTCAENCALEGVTIAGYNTTYGTTTSGNALNMLFGTGGQRLYLLDATGNYTDFKVMNQELTFDVNIANVPCGYNAALYFSEMQIDGGLGPLNKAGAAYGTGYCDSQCAGGTNFFDGLTNYNGSLGACCNEMDIWEANAHDTQLTPHPCNITGTVACNGDCSELCDPSGCDFNPFRMGNPSFYGPGLMVDTTKTFTVVTQFITNDSTPTGTLSEIRRFYVQDNMTMANPSVKISGLPSVNSISQEFCTDKIDVLDDAASFNTYGGLTEMGESLARGAVLVFSLWDSLGDGMFWLDGLEGSDASAPGALRGNCTVADSVADASASVTFSNIKVGDINSTFPSGGSSTSSSSSVISSATSASSTATSSAAGPTQTHYGQCGGNGWTGATTCASGYTCQVSNPYYSQCL